MLEKIRRILEEQLNIPPGSIAPTTFNATFSDNSWMSFVREDLSYFVLPSQKLSTKALYLLKQRVGDWLIKRTDIYSALETNGQWNHTLYLLSLAYFPFFILH